MDTRPLSIDTYFSSLARMQGNLHAVYEGQRDLAHHLGNGATGMASLRNRGGMTDGGFISAAQKLIHEAAQQADELVTTIRDHIIANPFLQMRYADLCLQPSIVTQDNLNRVQEFDTLLLETREQLLQLRIKGERTLFEKSGLRPF